MNKSRSFRLAAIAALSSALMFGLIGSAQAGKPGGGGSTDPCATPGLDFPAFISRTISNGTGDTLYVTDTTGTCSRVLPTSSIVIPNPVFSYPVDGTTDRGRVVWQVSGTIYALDFAVGPGNTVTNVVTRPVYSTTGCCALDLSKDGRSVYFADTYSNPSISKLDVATSAVTLIYASDDPAWYFSYASVNGDETKIFATKSANERYNYSSRLVRIDLNSGTEKELRRQDWDANAQCCSNQFFPGADKSTDRVAFIDYGANGCTALVVTDSDGNPQYPSGSMSPRFGRFPTWVGQDVVMWHFSAMNRKGSCSSTSSLAKIDLATDAETVVTTGTRADGR